MQVNATFDTHSLLLWTLNQGHIVQKGMAFYTHASPPLTLKGVRIVQKL